MLKITAPVGNNKRLYVVLLSGDSADIELQMAVDTLNWDCGLVNTYAFAVDCGIDDNCYQECLKICKSTRFSLVTVDGLAEIIKKSKI